MASRFVLTAQVQLQAPTNTRQVVNQIQQQLRGVNVQVNLQGGQQASRQVNNLNKATKQATTQATKMGKAFGASIRRFGAFTIATRAVSLFTNSLANATKEAIDFEREMVKISQVTGKTMAQLKGLENTITGLATSLGVSSKSILSVGRILSQAGIQAKDLEVALRTLAKTELAPTFDDITQTAEGAVAVLAQFGEGVGALERQLGAINRVAGQFAVEASDLISVIRRTGGVFKAAGGDLEELIALFTSVRATTRESAESIATGLRTIFTRIQRPKTIEFLKQFGIELTDLNGKFVGPFEAIRQLSGALSGLEQGDIQFVRIAEELGGFRQIGKVIPLLQQFETAERARQAALEGGDSLTKDAAKAQQALAVQIAKVKEEFLALIRSITQTGSFQIFVKTSLELASALIKVADALKPLIPLLATFGAIKFARGAAGFARGIGAGIRGFARGGMVPGTGNRDTVPAMLTPGEFVIRKSSVKSLGANTLAQMNENKRNRGTPGVRGELVKRFSTDIVSSDVGTEVKKDNRSLKIMEREFIQEADLDTYGAAFLRPFGKTSSLSGNTDPKRIKNELEKSKALSALNIKLNKSGTSFLGGKQELSKSLAKMANEYSKLNTFKLQAGSMPQIEAENLEDIVLGGVESTVREGASKLGKITGMKTPVDIASALKSANIDQVTGNIFEAMLAFAGAPFGGKAGDAANAPFDFDKGLGTTLAKKFDLSNVASRPTEAKSTFTSDALTSIAKKVENRNIAEAIADFQAAWLDTKPQLENITQAELERRGFTGRRAEQDERIASLKGRKTRFASGGGISGSDTIPAMLTPGEFVFNKKSAQSIGYSNLNRMNKQGVQGFNKGGPVGVQNFLFGGKAAKQNVADSFSREGTALVTTMSKVDDIMNEFVNSLTTLPEGVRESVLEMTKTFELTSQQQFKTNAGDRSGDQLRGVATATGVGINLKKAGEHTVKHEGAHQVDRALGGGKELASRQEGTFQNKIAKELMKTMKKELGVSAYRLDAAELFADALAKAPPEVQRILASTTDAAEGSKKLAEHFEKANAPVAGLADLSADEFGGIQDVGKRKKAAKTSLKENVKIRDSAKKRLGAVESRLKTETDKKSGLEARRDALLKARSSAVSKMGEKVGQTKLGQGKGQEPLTKAQLEAKEQYEIITKELSEQTKLINESEDSIKTLNKSRNKYKSAIDTAQGKIVSSSEQLKELKGRKAAKPVDMTKPSGKVRDLTPEVFKLNPPSKKPSKPSPEVFQITPKPTKGEEEKEEKKEQRDQRNIDANQLTNFLLGATALSALIPQVEGATEGFSAVQNELPALIGGLSAISGIASSINTEGKGVGVGFKRVAKAAIINAGTTIAINKVLDAYNGTHLKAEEAIKTASEANDEASLAAAEKAAVESANAKNLNKVAAGVSGAFGAAASAAEMIPGPWGKVAGVALRLGGVIAGVAIKMGALEAIGIDGDVITNFFAILGQGPSVNQIKAQTKATIQNARSQKILAEASKDAAEELKKIESGDLTATESLGAGGAAAKSAQAIAAQNEASRGIIQANNQINSQMDRVSNALASQGGIGGAVSSGIFDFFTGESRAANKQQSEAEKKSITDRNTKLINDLQPRLGAATREQVTAASAAGGAVSFEDFKKKIDPSILALAQNTDEMNGNTAEMDKLKQNFQNVKKATIDNIKFIKAMNFGLSDVTSGIAAYGASLNNLTASQETGFSTAAVAATTLSTAITSAGKNISSNELNTSLDLLGDNLQRFGANAKQISGAKELITGLNDVQKGAADALAAVKSGFAGGSTDPTAIKNQLKDAILGSIPDSSPIKQKLIDSFGNLDLPPEAIENFLNTGDVSGILDAAFGPISEQVQKQLIEPLNKLAEQEKVLIGLAQQRREAEQKLIAVQKQAIDTQIDAAKSLEFFGGPKFTPEKEFAARRQQANLTLQDAGIAGLTTGSAADIRSASQSIGSRFSTQQAAQNAAAIRGGGAFGGVAGVDRDRRPELKEANQALLTITKQGIEQRKQELELIKKKNQAEKDALNSLLGGDVESFFDQAIGAAAGSALRTGDAAAASLFGAGALGKGLQGLQGTGLSDAENLRASSLAFGAFGLGDDAARTFSGTTTEEERIKSEGRELAQLQSELADQSVELEEMTVTATTVVISAANLKMQEISDQVQRAQSIAGLDFKNRGGVVYASTGMFIPRGTDTVPAMLTPGEFVVNRAAVQRGNNLQILRSMNSNSAPIQATQALSSGGPVRYRANGSTGPEGPGGIDFSKFEEMVNKFQEVTDKLGNVNIKHMFEKLGTLDINHMFNGNMQQAFKDEILAEAGNMMSRSKFNSDGSITTSDRSVLG